MVDFYFASGMYKNQLQELAQRSCFNLPSYTCIREGPDHAPRFKATVNFNGDIFESPAFCTTLRQAEHSAAEVALGTLANRGPSRSLAARVLDETGAYKNLLQETVHRAGLNLPVYTTVRSGPGHVPVFTCNVELARMSFTGEPAKTKKQAQKNAAMAAWSSLKQLGSHSGSSSTTPSSSPSTESEGNEEQEQVIVSRVLARLCPPEMSKSSRNDKHRGRQRSVPVSRNTNLNSGGIPVYPIQYPSWPYSNFPSEAAMHQRWMQDQASHQQTRLLTLPVAPVPPPSPHIIPFIHSIMQPDNMQYFPQESIGLVPGITVAASGPSFCFSNHSMPYQANRSQVTIQEIQDERTQEKEKWVHGKTDPDSRKVNIHSNPSMFSPFEVQNPPMPGASQAESLIQGMPQDTAFGPRFINPNPVRFWLGSPHGLDSPHGNLRPHLLPIQSSSDMAKCYRPPSIAAPVMVRTVGPTSSVRPRPESLLPTRMPAPVTIRNATPSRSIRTRPLYSGGAVFMAPAVQIRSVVPVCSAPPTRKIPGSTQDGVLLGGDKKDENTKEAVISSVSELGKLELG